MTCQTPRPSRTRCRSRPRAVSLAFLIVLVLWGRNPGRPCTAFVIKGSRAVLLGKNLDWPVGEGYIFVNKRGVAKRAFGSSAGIALHWTSKFGSVTFNQFGREFPLGGINEAGLVVEELSASARYPAPDARPALNELQWIQYQLDTQATVRGLVRSASKVRISRLFFRLHFLVADAGGRRAVIEFIDGKMTVYEGGGLPVSALSNNGYAESIRYLRLHRGFGGDRTPSGGPESIERFVMAATMLEDYGLPGQRLMPDDGFGILKAVEQSDTQWSIVYNLPRRLVFFKTRAHRRLKLINLAAFDFSCRGPVLMLPVTTEAGWILTEAFKPYEARENRRLIASVFARLKQLDELPSGLPEDLPGWLADYPETCRCR
jgi:penicillin V acylase-like amidase (Ntn superfamily)